MSKDLLKYKIPCDSIWLDLEHTDKKKIFTFNNETFPNPKAMLDEITINGGRKLVLILDPHVKKDPDFLIYQGVHAGNLAVRRSD